MSRSLFYELRSGNRPITAKVWRKLETAEREAGIEKGQADTCQFAPNTEKRVKLTPGTKSEGSEELTLEALAARMDRLEQLLETILDRLDRPPTSCKGHGKKSA
jgi:hypothetical protein